MLPFSTLLSLLVIVCTRRGFAQLLPTTPGPNETYTAGLNCTIAWNTDTSGTWKNVSIDLMSGSNNNMSLVTNVITDLDGTNSSLTPLEWTCPELDPYSAIYFYQFTNGNDTSTRTWTTRFTIASPANEIEAPENSVQPDGENVPWGRGRLSDTKPAWNSSASRLSFSERPHSATGFHSWASSSESPTAYDGDRPQRHAPNDTDSIWAASRTRPARIATTQSDSAGPSGTPRIRGGSQNSDIDQPDGPNVNHRDEDGQSNPLPLNGAQAEPLFSGSSSAYKNPGAADTNGIGGSQLELSNVITSVAPPVIIALVVLYM